MTRIPNETSECAVAKAKRELAALNAAIAHCQTFSGLYVATIAYAAASRRLEQAQRSAL